MFEITIQKNYTAAVHNFNKELNDFHEQQIGPDRPYSGDGALLEYVEQLEQSFNEKTDLTFELGKKTRRGHVASFAPSVEWQRAYLHIETDFNNA
jgi:hypothetical protein